MISNYLTSKRKATNVSDNAGKNEVGRPEPKMSKKITSLIRFSREKTPNRIKELEKNNSKSITHILLKVGVVVMNYFVRKNILFHLVC